MCGGSSQSSSSFSAEQHTASLFVRDASANRDLRTSFDNCGEIILGDVLIVVRCLRPGLASLASFSEKFKITLGSKHFAIGELVDEHVKALFHVHAGVAPCKCGAGERAVGVRL